MRKLAWRFPEGGVWGYLGAMHVATYEAFLDELSQIEKDAGIKDIFTAGTRALKTGVNAANTASLRGLAKVHSHPIGKHVVNHLMDPGNTPDIARSLSNIFH